MSKSIQGNIGAFALAILAAAVSGCGSSSSPNPVTTTQSAAGRAVLDGTYKRTMTDADLQRTKSFRQEGPNQSAPPAGRYRLIIARRNQQTVLTSVDPTGFQVPMNVKTTASGGLVIQSYVDPYKASACGPTVAAQAAYGVIVTGATLTLRSTKDACADRDSVLTGTWVRQ